jgi:hypothetical protein
MSVDSKIFVGLTVELDTNLTHADFAKLHELEEKYPEIDEFNYNHDDREGRILLIYDGMNSQFARLIFVDKLSEGGNLGYGNHEPIELAAPKSCFNPELIAKMSKLYEEYTGKPVQMADFKYVLWDQWT